MRLQQLSDLPWVEQIKHEGFLVHKQLGQLTVERRLKPFVDDVYGKTTLLAPQDGPRQIALANSSMKLT